MHCLPQAPVLTYISAMDSGPELLAIGHTGRLWRLVASVQYCAVDGTPLRVAVRNACRKDVFTIAQTDESGMREWIRWSFSPRIHLRREHAEWLEAPDSRGGRRTQHSGKPGDVADGRRV